MCCIDVHVCVCVWMGGEVCVTNGGDLVAGIVAST